MREQAKRQSFLIAFCALMAALGAVLMAAGGLIPIATYCAPMLASVLLLPVMAEFGKREAWMVWAVTAALSLMLSADKEAAFLYLFLGFYPLLKPVFDRIRPKALAFLAKLLFFAVMLGAMYALLIFLFQLDTLIEEFRAATVLIDALFFLSLLVVMMIYDLAFGRIYLYYLYRVRPKLPFSKR